MNQTQELKSTLIQLQSQINQLSAKDKAVYDKSKQDLDILVKNNGQYAIAAVCVKAVELQLSHG
ncbi:hypothetical protein [Veronia pacifica]|uniref:Uncharacterized protein n=1 Tax=Veronia pacifica TaxID=1080227 RepID=A0A1C3EIE3_9GAMM|nr:hypothetical protein [Veronia pacifica]ODA32993.1 hypothetical protein A8L45_11900 [Veronia pacifica]